VLPSYRAAPLAIRSVARLSTFLESTTMTWEVIVVDDGGGDFAPGDLCGDRRARLLRLPQNRGKGAAVAHGMKAATGHVRVFTDADLPYDLELIPAMVDYVRARGFHVVIGDRTLPQSSYLADIGFKRRLASTLFSAFVGTMVTGGFFDTQCGLKAVRGDVADELFAIQRLDRFAFDVEFIYLALHHRLDIKRIPVQLRNNETSSVRLVRDSARSLVDIARIKYNQMRGRYSSRVLERLVYEEFSRMRDHATGPGVAETATSRNTSASHARGCV
jgi:glycosyltransferase involved in cell wall biosynthesis